MSIDYKNTINLPQTTFAMKADLAKREPAMLAEWEKSDRYGEIQKHTANREHAFILHDGPPYANGAIHLGHAVNKILKDIVVKSKLMAGLRSPYVPGWDCHGLPIEVAVEKKVGKVGVKVDAAEFRKLCREYAAKQIDLQRADFKRLGVLGEWENPYRTMDFKYEADTIRALSKVVANGHLLRGDKPVYWCFDCGSALAEAEIEYQDKTSSAIDVAYDALDPKALAAKFGVGINDGDIVAVPIWTTTPWSLPGSVAVTLGPDIDYALIEGPQRAGKRVLLVVAVPLLEKAAKRYNVENATPLGHIKGAGLESLPPRAGEGAEGGRGRSRDAEPSPQPLSQGERSSSMLRHPFYDREIPIICGDHVTTDDGTGAVHTAPSHGMEDFTVAREYNIDIINPLGPNGVYTPATEIFAGQYIWKANDTIADLLRERGVLLAAEKITHSYPHCWRHRTPVVFRATPQWFIGMETAGLRAGALKAIRDDVDWYPAWGEERIYGMIKDRPDWCISRQRTWGVPIALFVHKSTSAPHPRSVELMEQVAQRIEKGGADTWYALDPHELLGAEADDYTKVTDILDVWFDSGVTHFCVLDQRANLARNPGDKVMYLEGSDQHRGWFHSSLLTSVAMHGHAPYDEVLTHGFTVDAQGRKMSKSLGNGIEPQDVMKTYGADILRLWIASADYRNEMALSDEILKRVADSYRRIRNTARFLLGNLAGFDPTQHLVPVEKSLLLDQWAVQQAYDVQQAVIAAYARYDFPEVVQRIQNFCTNELGSLYLDITKDRLYTMQPDSHGRRSAQSAMYRILEALARWLAPILSFTAEEIWPLVPGKRDASVLFETFYDGLEATQGTPQQRQFWADLLAIRAATAKLLEGMRNEGAIGAALEAEVVLYAPESVHARLAPFVSELRFFFITSELRLADTTNVPAGAQSIEVDNQKLWSSAHVSGEHKCIRCWHRRPDVGVDPNHPEICGRCVTNLPDGPGENRRYF
ncbi:MAG TPA: isoleucine--tRNA ligase [Rudaea sp.]|jgi:isoleucyl-tRNA synthetase|uniref:isoleucine--tRNA ligase n=1 Tax=Rudaea sp. TaxID=2136325 RepID=UPI002F926896